ncbi:hypothetical protein E2986_11932 [Frieseomelitta varia]|uniref:Uncharacterized protein n=1 Tax=Frieseomelitta varia TaxID=561572 RepID=A0A833S6J8_9HYME|nr:hypothetical protein E2986_11932 [Frieseomelitta varia]
MEEQSVHSSISDINSEEAVRIEHKLKHHIPLLSSHTSVFVSEILCGRNIKRFLTKLPLTYSPKLRQNLFEMSLRAFPTVRYIFVLNLLYLSYLWSCHFKVKIICHLELQRYLLCIIPLELLYNNY